MLNIKQTYNYSIGKFDDKKSKKKKENENKHIIKLFNRLIEELFT